MSLFKNVNVVSLYVSDWERAREFYARVLDWPVAWADDSIGWVEYGGEKDTHLAINRWDGPGEMPLNGGVIPVLSVADAYAVAAALRQMGVHCDDVIDIPGVVTYGTFYDPDGNRIQFASTGE